MIAHAVFSSICFSLLNKVTFEKGKNYSFSEQAVQELGPAEQFLREKIAVIFIASINCGVTVGAMLAESYFSLQNSVVFHMYVLPYPILALGLTLYVVAGLVKTIVFSLFQNRVVVQAPGQQALGQQALGQVNPAAPQPAQLTAAEEMVYALFKEESIEGKKEKLKQVHCFFAENLNPEEWLGFRVFFKETIVKGCLKENLTQEDLKICFDTISYTKPYHIRASEFYKGMKERSLYEELYNSPTQLDAVSLCIISLYLPPESSEDKKLVETYLDPIFLVDVNLIKDLRDVVNNREKNCPQIFKQFYEEEMHFQEVFKTNLESTQEETPLSTKQFRYLACFEQKFATIPGEALLAFMNKKLILEKDSNGKTIPFEKELVLRQERRQERRKAEIAKQNVLKELKKAIQNSQDSSIIHQDLLNHIKAAKTQDT